MDSHDRENGINKSRYWVGIVYTENCKSGWQDAIGDDLQLPAVYAIHDQDLDESGAPRKPHAHVLVCFPNTTTRKHAKEVLNTLSAPGKVCCSTAQACINIRHTYEYLIHNTETAKKEGKHLYPESARVGVNGFDIGIYEVVSAKEKHEMVFELSKLVSERGIENMRDLFAVVSGEYDFRHFECYLANNAYFDRLCRGVYLSRVNNGGVDKPKTDTESLDPGRVALAEVIARAADGTRVAVCEDCGEVKPVADFVSYGGENGMNIGVCRFCSTGQ